MSIMSGTWTCKHNRSNIYNSERHFWNTQPSCSQFILSHICLKVGLHSLQDKNPSETGIQVSRLLCTSVRRWNKNKEIYHTKPLFVYWTGVSSRTFPKRCHKIANDIMLWQHRQTGRTRQWDDNWSCSTRQKLCIVNQKWFPSSKVTAARIVLVWQD